MTKAFSNINLAPIREALPNVALPDMPPGPLGRFRLVQTLQARYGENFRSIQTARKALEHFDAETEQVREFMSMKERLHGRSI